MHATANTSWSSSRLTVKYALTILVASRGYGGSYVVAVPRRSTVHGKQRAVTTPVHSAEDSNSANDSEDMRYSMSTSMQMS